MSSNENLEKIGFKRILIFGIIAMVVGGLVYFVFDYGIRRSTPMSEVYRWIDKNIGRELFCGFLFVGGLIIAIRGYIGLRQQREAKVSVTDNDDEKNNNS